MTRLFDIMTGKTARRVWSTLLAAALAAGLALQSVTVFAEDAVDNSQLTVDSEETATSGNYDEEGEDATTPPSDDEDDSATSGNYNDEEDGEDGEVKEPDGEIPDWEKPELPPQPGAPEDVATPGVLAEPAVAFTGLEDLHIDPLAFNQSVDLSSLDGLEGADWDAAKDALFKEALAALLLENVTAADEAGNPLTPYIVGELDVSAILPALKPNPDGAVVTYGALRVDPETAEEREFTQERRVFAEALAQTTASANSHATLLAAINAAPDNVETEINITGSFTLTSVITISASKIIKLTGSGTITAAANSRHFTVTGKLTLAESNEITLTGGYTASGGSVYVSGGTFTMEDGTISGNTAPRFGGSVYVNGGAFTMEGGTISGNTAKENGGGVYVNTNATFTMEGGTIGGNKANSSSNSCGNGGGVYVNTNATFDMTGGTISENEAISNSIYGSGGGVYVYSGKFSMVGGTIGGNTANGHGGGVFNRGTFTMEGGTITGNTAVTQSGGGVVVNGNATFEMTGGDITGNTVTGYYGGGIMNLGTTTLTDSVIIGNTSNDSGGGIANMGIDAIITMTDSAITGNTANSGGGMYINNSTFIMTGGTFSGNTAKHYGGGIWTGDYNDRLTISEGAVFSGNTAKLGAYRYTGEPLDNIKWAGKNSLGGTMESGIHLLNNYDVNYTGGTALAEHKVTFDAAGGAPTPDAQTVYTGFMVTKPADPTLDETHTFLGWFTDEDALWNFESDTVQSDLTLTAKYEMKTYTVTFVDWDGEVIAADG